MTQIIAEIGINHNGSLEITKRLIDEAVEAGADYVKFQKRDPDICVPDEMKNVLRDTPWGRITYLEYKKNLEFSYLEYEEIDKYCKLKGIKWFLSVWDLNSAEFAREIDHTIVKIPSALALDQPLLEYCRKHFETLIISVGMCEGYQIQSIIDRIKPDVIMHTNSSYPSPIEELNLNHIKWLEKVSNGSGHRFEIGYSGHEFGLVTTFAAVAMGATWIERHITLDRTMWGSDQESSVEPLGFKKLVKGIRDIEKSLGEYGPRKVTPSEHQKIKSLRK